MFILAHITLTPSLMSTPALEEIRKLLDIRDNMLLAIWIPGMSVLLLYALS